MKKKIYRPNVPDKKPFERDKPRSIDDTIDMMEAIRNIKKGRLAEAEF